jgi:autoinducer 2-degrading protein
MGYVVTVEFDIEPRHAAVFLPLVCENAQLSRRREPGCLQFDVCTDPARPNVVFLYERYSGRQAFEAHLASDHFARFVAAARGKTTGKRVQMLQRVDPSP